MNEYIDINSIAWSLAHQANDAHIYMTQAEQDGRQEQQKYYANQHELCSAMAAVAMLSETSEFSYEALRPYREEMVRTETLQNSKARLEVAISSLAIDRAAAERSGLLDPELEQKVAVLESAANHKYSYGGRTVIRRLLDGADGRPATWQSMIEHRPGVGRGYIQKNYDQGLASLLCDEEVVATFLGEDDNENSR